MNDTTYRNDPALKAELVARMRDHQDADRLIRGTYWDVGKGCAVGCTVIDILAAEQGVSLADVDIDDTTWHEEWARVTGLPEWLGRLGDWLFENLPGERWRSWPLELLEAVPVGVNLDRAREEWLRDVVFDPERGAMAHAANALVVAGLPDHAGVLRSMHRLTDWAAARDAAGDAAGAAGDAAEDAARAARDAARAARDAAGAAGAAGDAGDAARAARDAAEDAARAARDAARAADWDSGDAARAAAIEWIADRLLHHLKGTAA
jgi:hypothetical protein